MASVSAAGDASRRVYFSVKDSARPDRPGDSKNTDAANEASVKKLLRELEDADRTPGSPVARDLRDKLNALREEIGDKKLEEILKKLIEEAAVGDWLDFLRKLMKALFPGSDDAPPAPAPAPAPAPSPRGGGGGGGGGGGANRNDFGPSERMSNLTPTEGSKHFDYKPDNSNPRQKPSTEKGQPGNIWSGFSQGPDGNCITVSAIKAAMMHFGQKPTDVFKEVKENGNGFDVTMRDGVHVFVSKNELEQAAKYAQFKGDDPAMMTDANFMYAASAKRAMKEGNDGRTGMNFFQAMESLNDGEHAREGLDRLGLKGHYRPATDADLRNSKVGTVEYGGHSMAVINGRVELWGGRGGVPQSGTATVLF
ncbi:hypothetical protein [Pseudomonas sp. F8002]|jgi:hypothetical protein|uniref:hypothetical protein n=1 Tax=Pseudomonas sp. F8002 TaxID=2738822 RepID=UPI0015A28839|nr:hypothetical protein [Pseudomonas sp. F8002]NWB54739.1 hypothetical protein [Pseudomonas sp. F8002]